MTTLLYAQHPHAHDKYKAACPTQANVLRVLIGERTAANSPIQGSAADLIKIAMIRIDDTLRSNALESKMLLQVHDELVFEISPSELDQVQELVKREMENAAQLSVPLVVDLGVGANWLETKES